MEFMMRESLESSVQRIRSCVSAPLRKRYGRTSMSRPYEISVVGERKDLAGKLAVVTGGGGALGRAITILLSAEGAHVHILGRNAERLRRVVEEVASLGGSAVSHRVDITRAQEIEAVFDDLRNVDILVNNAGGSARDRSAPIWLQSVDVIDEIMDVNLRAAIMCTRAAARHMVNREAGGRVILIGSTVGVGGKANFSEYAAAKAGVLGFARSAALELGPFGVTVNCVSPGIIPRGALNERQLKSVTQKSVLPRVGKPEDVAELVVFLSGHRAEFITGQHLVVDGGRSLGLRGDY